jgi:hypothetical protein
MYFEELSSPHQPLVCLVTLLTQTTPYQQQDERRHEGRKQNSGE